MLANELKRDFDVKEVPLMAKEIDKDLNVLLVIHPREVPPQTEYALDQFVMRGGKLIAFVDPYAYFDQGPQMPGMPPQPSSSTLPTLFKAWGVTMDPGKVVSDVVFGSGGGARYTPTVLSLNRTAFSRDDIVTSQIETLLYAFGGAFELKLPDHLKVERAGPKLAERHAGGQHERHQVGRRSDARLQAVGQADAARVAADRQVQDRLPRRIDRREDKPVAGTPALRESAENSVIIVADVDLLADGAAVDVQEVFGRRIVVPSNGNLAFAMGMVEQFAAGNDLISLRSRAAAFRPLTVVRELEAEAQKEYFGRIQALEDEKQKTQARLQELQKAQGGAAKGAQILSSEQQAELERFKKTYSETNLALKELRKNLRQDAEALVFWTKVANIALMPLLVALAGLLVAFFRRRLA